MCRECDAIAREAFRAATGGGGPVTAPAAATYARLADGSTVEVRCRMVKPLTCSS